MDSFKKEEFFSKLPKNWSSNRNKNCTALIKLPENIKETKVKKRKIKIDYDKLPERISKFLFLSFNIFIYFIAIYIILQIILSIKNDIKIRIDNEYHKIEELKEKSNYLFLINKCNIVNIPEMKRKCMEWKRNLSKSRNDIERMGIIMDLFGEIFDRFLEQISWKFFVTIFCLVIAFFTFYRK